MKKLVSLLLVLTLMLMFAACSSNEASETDEPTTLTGSELKIAMVLPGTINDNGFSSAGYRSLAVLEEMYGCTTTYVESIALSDSEDVFRAYAEDDYNIIIGHSGGYASALKAVATDYPDKYFIIGGSGEDYMAPNVCGNYFRSEERGFIIGVAMALLSKTGNIATIMWEESGTYTDVNTGIAAGAKSINPDINLIESFSGTESDIAKVKEMTNALIVNNNVDVVFTITQAASIGAIEACQEHGVYYINNNADGYELAPDTVVVSSLIDYGMAVKPIIDDILAGNFQAKVYYVGAAEGCFALSSFHDWPEKLDDPSVLDKITETYDQICAGEIDLSDCYVDASRYFG